MRTHVLKRLIVAVLLLAGFATVSPLPAVAAGVTGIDIYVINSNGVRCGQDCVSQSQAQVAMCVRSSQNVVNYTTMSYGYTLRRGATVVSSSSYSPLDASSTCVSGYMHTWDFRDLTAGESYEVEGWMIDDNVSYSAVLSFTTAGAYNASTSTTINPLSTSTTIAVDTLVPGAPQVDMYEGPSVGAWNLVDNATGAVLSTIVGNPLCCGRNGTYRSTALAQTATYIWNPIGAGSGGVYYTNGLYVTQWGQHILPGTSSLIAAVGPPPTTIFGEPTDPIGSSTTSTVAGVEGARSGNGVASVVGLTDVGLVVEKLGKKYSIVVTSPLRNAPVIIRATAKGKPTITWSAKTNVNAQKLILSTRSLKGYTLSLWVNGRRLSSVNAG
jgi:hypothetical protein